MSNYVRAADAIRDAFGCAVLIVHHCGINDLRPRGHTSLTGAADAQIAVKRDINGTIGVTVEFLKDGEAGETIASNWNPSKSEPTRTEIRSHPALWSKRTRRQPQRPKAQGSHLINQPCSLFYSVPAGH